MKRLVDCLGVAHDQRLSPHDVVLFCRSGPGGRVGLRENPAPTGSAIVGYVERLEPDLLDRHGLWVGAHDPIRGANAGAGTDEPDRDRLLVGRFCSMRTTGV